MLIGSGVTDEQEEMFGRAIMAMGLEIGVDESAIISGNLTDGTPVVLGCAVLADDAGQDQLLPMLILITPEVRHLFEGQLAPLNAAP